MALRLDSYRDAYRLAHAAGWDAGERRMVRAGRTAWDRGDFAAAAAAFRQVMMALGHPEPELRRPAPRERVRTAHGKPTVLRRQPRHPARAGAR